MGTRTEYTPGTFSWAELATSDPAAAKAFYGELFGWEPHDRPAGPGATYTMLTLDGHHVAALMGQCDDALAPHWNCYVTVADVDATAGEVEAAGGTLVAAPFDVMDAGRMAVVRDPVGAVVSLWQAGAHPGAGLVNVPGALTWNDLLTDQAERARPFYTRLFGWEYAEPGGGYTLVLNRGRSNGGMLAVPGAPPAWIPYFAVTDTHATLARVDALGGGVLNGPLDVPAGRIAAVRDPHGAVFALFAGTFER